MPIKPSKFKAGFTLVEMLVSITIFVLVAFTITATLIAVSSGNRKAQEVKQVMDNLNFSIQAMVLRMREGIDYTCAAASAFASNPSNPTLPVSFGEECSSGEGDAIVFHDPTLPAGGSLTKVSYYLAGDPATGHRIIRTDSAAFGGGQYITSPEVDIDRDGLKFIVGGVGQNADQSAKKPFVIIQVSGRATLRSGGETRFNLQTFVAQRN